MGRSDCGCEGKSRKAQRYAMNESHHKAKRNVMERDDRQARQMLVVPQQPTATHKPNNKKLVEYQGSNGKIQRYSYANEQESQEKRVYARNSKQEYQAFGYQRHAKEEYRGYSSNVWSGRRSSPPPKLQMMKNQNPMLKKKAVTYKDDDSTSSNEDEDESSSEEEDDESSSSSSSDDEAKCDQVFKRMSRMEMTTTKMMKSKMMKSKMMKW